MRTAAPGWPPVVNQPQARSPVGPRWAVRRGFIRTSGAAAAAGAAALVVPGHGWALSGGLLTTALVLAVISRRLAGGAARYETGAADLPVACDLVAAALRAGAPPGRAVDVVGEALGGPVGERLRRVGAALAAGAAPATAWGELAGLDGADRLVRAATHSADRGSALAAALVRVADDLRAARASAADARVRRLGVLVVLPLGLCFLPAFLLAGVVPVVVAVLGDVLRAR
jgi:Flp pilus assembly protein TadB